VSVALDATYSVGRNLSGVGVYSRKLLWGLAAAHPEESFYFQYRPHRFLRSLRDTLPSNAHRRLLTGPATADIFHALNQRVDHKSKRTISTFHDLFVLTGDYSTVEFRARFTQQAKIAAERSDLIIAVSDFTARQVESLLGIPRARIRVVRHGVDLPPASAQPREKLVLFTGAIQRRKNVARLVEAFQAMPPDWTLVLAGADDGYGAAQELAAINTPRIQIAGYVSRDQLASLYARSSIFAFPSLDEGFGMPVLEAMAHGVPVITSNCSAMPEVAGDGALLIDPYNVAALADALCKLAADDQLRALLTQRGLHQANAHPWDRAVRETWSVYQELAV
jgi:glycosyltransferase involved in cell wall biosynthesis